MGLGQKPSAQQLPAAKMDLQDNETPGRSRCIPRDCCRKQNGTGRRNISNCGFIHSPSLSSFLDGNNPHLNCEGPKEGSGCRGGLFWVVFGLFFFKKWMIHIDMVWTCCNRISVNNPPGFPTALVYPCLEIRSKELGNIPKTQPRALTSNGC